MTNLDQLQSDLKEAMLAHNEVKVSTLRLILAAVANSRIAKGEDLTADEITKLIQKEAKQIDEAISGAQQANREDLVQKNQAEKDILSAYLPEQMDPSKLEEIIVKTIHEIGANTPQDMGKVMAAVMPKLGGAADGATVSRLVSQHLGS